MVVRPGLSRRFSGKGQPVVPLATPGQWPEQAGSHVLFGFNPQHMMCFYLSGAKPQFIYPLIIYISFKHCVFMSQVRHFCVLKQTPRSRAGDMDWSSILIFLFFGVCLFWVWGHTPWCSGLTPDIRIIPSGVCVHACMCVRDGILVGHMSVKCPTHGIIALALGSPSLNSLILLSISETGKTHFGRHLMKQI